MATAISVTPATRAGTQHITTDDGYAARPPGTYTPARLTGRFCTRHRVTLGKLHRHVIRQLGLRNAAYVRDRGVKADPHLGVEPGECRVELLLRHAQGGNLPVVAPGQLPHRLVAALAHVGENRRDGVPHVGGRLGKRADLGRVR